MRKTIFAPKEHYHLFGRGVNKMPLFLDKHDWSRFLFLILHGQSPLTIHNTSQRIHTFVQHGSFNLWSKTIQNILERQTSNLIAFTLMPNHFHLIVEEKEEGGVSSYMHRILMGYAKYFNKKYDRSGHVFQGPFGATHIDTNEQLLHTSAYVHKNPIEIPKWKKKIEHYPWSSYQDYLRENRWGKLLKRNIVLEQFKTSDHYRKFVETSVAKEVNG